MAQAAASVPPALSPPHCEAAWQQAPVVAMGGQPLHSVPSVVKRGGELVLRCQPVGHRHHRAARMVAEASAQQIVRANAANGEAAPMKVHQGRQHRVRRRVQPRVHQKSVAGGHRYVFHPRQRWRGRLQHICAGSIGQARLLGREGVQRRGGGSGHAVQNFLHRRAQQGQRFGMRGGRDGR